MISSKPKISVALLPGDGIGPEVTGAAVRVLEALSATRDIAFEFSEQPVGAGEYLRSGSPLPEAAFAACESADAVLLGAMGLPDVRWPDGKEMTPQIDLRERLQLYNGLRPIYLYHPDDSPLKNHAPGDIDFVIVRENTEGLFSARLAQRSDDGSEARDTLRITRAGSERIFHAAFKEARRRGRQKKVTLVDKANVLPSMVYFREIFDEVAGQYPDCTTEHVYVDAAALFLVRRPQDFDVIVTENMFGDILSDLAAGLVGGMGMAPSGDIGDACAVFQPSHGTAPDIAGQGKANPVAMVLSAAMMLDWLGRTGAADAVRTAVSAALENRHNRTPDMGGTLTTDALTDLIIQKLPTP